ncbi:MAG: hypothetical protein ABL903_04635 [Methylococcales bacterium]
MRIVIYLISVILPVLLAWLLGYVQFPESTYFLDYSRGGSDILNLDEELKKNIVVLVGGNKKEKLSLYSVHFINESLKHHDKIDISFVIDPKDGTELIASTLQAPENYPKDSIKKISATQNEVKFSLDHVNRAGNQARNYFTASFLFSGSAPVSITPESHEKGVEFRLASENTKNIAYISIFIFYITFFCFLWWITKKMNLKLEEKSIVYKQNLKKYLSENLLINIELLDSSVQEIERIHDQAYKPSGFIKKSIKSWLKEL